MILFTLLIISLTGIFNEQSHPLPEELFKTWYHSFEEDKKNIQYYRPEGYELPLRRGRDHLQLKSDGSFTEYKIAPTDGYLAHKGKWKARHCGKIKINIEEPVKYQFSMVLISVNDSLLKLRRLDASLK